MQKNHQHDEQFMQDIGVLLAAHVSHGRPIQQHQTIAHLAEYVTSARRHQKLTRAALAQKTGKTEAEIYALEQGLLSYAELDLRFLSKLATALGEDVETLLLLLGRPALVQALQMQEARKKHEHHQSIPCQRPTTADTTGSKQCDNSIGNKLSLNLLYSGCRNLIDSLQQGRLPSYIRVNYQAYPVMALFVCLCLVWVSTYSLFGNFGAQSTLQSYTVPPLQVNAATSTDRYGETALSATQRTTVTTIVIHPIASPQSAYRQHEVIAQAVADSIDGPSTIRLSQAEFNETQQCDIRTTGRFALCRV
jgi:transcriptional regulator with XRE-family HTH domain